MRAGWSRRSVRRLAVLAEAACCLTLALLALRLLPFRWLSSAAARPEARAGAQSASPDRRAAGVGTAIASIAARLPWRSTCLVRALAGRLMLARRGVPSVLCLGVAKEAGALRAHAWLLAGGGTVCGGPEADDYTAIAELPTGPTPRARAS